MADELTGKFQVWRNQFADYLQWLLNRLFQIVASDHVNKINEPVSQHNTTEIWSMTTIFTGIVLCSILLILVGALRCTYVVYTTLKHRNVPSNNVLVTKKRGKVKTMIIMGSGGHTAEMLQLLSGMRSDIYSPREYVIATTDIMSHSKVKTFERMTVNELSVQSQFTIHTIPRSREVKQSWLSTMVSTLYACLYAIPLVFKIKPQLVLCNGPGTCIPLCGAAFLLKLLMIKDTKIVYVESICRVKTLSLSGKILYWFADHILVQWPNLVESYPLTKYIGRLS